MPRPLDPATRDALAERLRFYRDLGLTDFYRRPVEDTVDGAPSLHQAFEEGAGARVGDHALAPPAQPEPQALSIQADFFGEESAIKTRKGFHAPEIGAVVPAEERAAALLMIRDEIGDCTRCALHKGRHSIVFADGSPAARLMFVGEGPGADEDAQGLPFVGRAGQLLNNMIAAMGLKR